MRLRKPQLNLATDKLKTINPGAAAQNVLAATPFDPKKMDKRTRKRVVRWGIIGGNFLLLLMIAVFLFTNR